MSRTYRIWHLLSNRWNSAITEYALSSARALKLRGHTSLFSPLAESPAQSRAEAYLECEPFKSFGLGEIGHVLALSDEYRPDIVFTYGGPETFLASLLKRARDVKIYRFRGQGLSNPGFAAGLKHKLSHSFVETVITPSEKLASQLKDLDPSTHAVCVPLGIDVEKFTRTPVAPVMRPELVILGRLDAVKGHQEAFKIMADVLRHWPKDPPRPRLHVIGEPANLSGAHLEGYVRDAGLRLGDDVMLTIARVAKIPEVLSRSALGWVSSVGSEIIGRVAEEFLACGTPVAVSGVGSLDEVLFEDAGFSYHGASADETARQFTTWILKSLSEGEAAKLARMQKARSLYSLEQMGEKLEALF